MMESNRNYTVKNAIMLGVLCSVAYLAVYVARNVLGAVTPQMLEGGNFTTEYIGKASSLYFIMYAIGQLINGAIGDKVKARYMISFGLILAGICTVLFPIISDMKDAALIVYGMTGFFLSMIYAPMTKVVSENTQPIHAVRCNIGYTFASFFGSPLAGVIAATMVWQSVFTVSSIALFVMGAVCFTLFLLFEKKGIIQYKRINTREKGNENGVKVLLKRKIGRYTVVSIVTGVVRTTVIFWLPTYLAQYLGFSPENSAMIFTVATLIISASAFIAMVMYEVFKRDMERTMLLFFVLAIVFFAVVYLVKMPVLNIIFLVLAITSSNCAASVLWSMYCPSLADTGMVSTATGFLDFVSYMAASISSTLFANAVSSIGWGNLILVWVGLMVFGFAVSLPGKKQKAE